MSDSEPEDVVDYAKNESVDWGEEKTLDDDVFETATKNTNNLYTIHEESFLSTTSQRPKFDAPTTFVPVDKNASKSFSDEGLATSFGGQNISSNSADFCANKDDIMRLMEKEQNALDNSGRRLHIPENYDINTANFANSSWDKGPHKWNVEKISTSAETLANYPSSQENHENALALAQKPATPIKNINILVEEKITPVRRQHGKPESFRRRSTLSTTTSTPKATTRGNSRLLDFGDISEIQGQMNNTTVQTIVLDQSSAISAESLLRVQQNLPPDAGPKEMMNAFEDLRIRKLQKQAMREKERAGFSKAAEPKKILRNIVNVPPLQASPRRLSVPVDSRSSVEKGISPNKQRRSEGDLVYAVDQEKPRNRFSGPIHQNIEKKYDSVNKEKLHQSTVIKKILPSNLPIQNNQAQGSLGHSKELEDAKKHGEKHKDELEKLRMRHKQVLELLADVDYQDKELLMKNLTQERKINTDLRAQLDKNTKELQDALRRLRIAEGKRS